MITIRQFAASAVFGVAVVAATGCASTDRPGDVPMSAKESGVGREELLFTAPESGTVYVSDATRRDVVYTGRVKKGDVVHVNAKDNKVLVNSMSVTEKDLLNDHKYKVYFEESAEKTAADSNTTIIRTEPGAAQPAGGTVIRTDPNTRTTVTTDPNAPQQQPRTSVTTDPNTGRTSVTTDPNAPAQPAVPAPKTTVETPSADGKTTITTDPNTGRTTVKQQQ